MSEISKVIEAGTISGLGLIDSDIFYKAGLDHDLGMSPHSFANFQDSTMAFIDDAVANPYKYEEYLKEMFGINSEMIACLALIHSKSTSDVQNIISYSELSQMVQKLYGHQMLGDKKIYNFDISKLVECDATGEPIYQTIDGKQVYVFKEEIA